MGDKMYYNHHHLLRIVCILMTVSLIICVSTGLAEEPVVIKLATLAPSGSPWHENLKEIRAKWKEASKGQVELRIYPGGTAGDEGAMVRKMRIGQLQGAMITNSGLANISPAINALIVPLLADSYEKLDRVRQQIGVELIRHYDEKGFIILNWGDAGWVRFFVTEKDPSIDKVKKAKMFVWAGDDRIVELWKNVGFNAIPLAATDMLPALQTGMVNAYPTTAIMSLASQWFAFTPYMIDLPWAPLVGATVVSKRTWNQIPETIRPQLLTIAAESGFKLQSEVRQLENKAIEEMKKRGLTILTLKGKKREEWHRTIKSVWPKMRGEIVPEKWFDAAVGALDPNGDTQVSKID
jgi:TRAP-type C4-dicarboxylate transport system substrate-binding protein